MFRVQVKNGVLRERVVPFSTCSNRSNTPRDYVGHIDYFAVYCHELATVFLIPLEDVPARKGRLRVGVPRNNQRRGIRWAEQYRLDWTPPALQTRAEIIGPPDE